MVNVAQMVTLVIAACAPVKNLKATETCAFSKSVTRCLNWLVVVCVVVSVTGETEAGRSNKLKVSLVYLVTSRPARAAASVTLSQR